MRGWKSARVAMLLVAVLPTLPALPAAAAGAPTRGFVVEARSNTLLAFDPTTNAITNRLSFPFTPVFGVRPDGREVYVADHWGDRVQVVATATHSVVATIAVRPHPTSFAFTPDSRTVYIGNDESAAVTAVDTASRRITAVIPVVDRPHHPAMSPDGRRVYVGTDAVNVLSRKVAVIDTGTNQLVRSIPLPDNGNNQRVYFAPNGRLAIVEGGAVIDTATETVTRQIAGRFRPTDLVFAPDSGTVYVSDFCGNGFIGAVWQYDVGTGRLLRRVVSGAGPKPLALTSDGTRLYVGLQRTGGVAVIDPASGQVLDTFGITPAGSPPLFGHLDLSDTAPAPTTPGQRFPPTEDPTGECIP